MLLYHTSKEEIKHPDIDKEFAQELVDCIFVLLNHVNKTRDDVSDQAFAGYAVFQNFGVGG